MNKQVIAAATTLTLALSSAAVAGDIYKWVDEDGNVHYGDKPIDTTQTVRVAIDSKPTDPARIAAQTQARVTARTEAREAEAEAAAAGPSEEELQAQAQQRRQACEKSRANMQRMATARRLYREDESGEREYLDEAEMEASRQRVEDEISEFCS
ncbi:MAG: DUF4124 domain-containing protein [Woeseiaceae bacterium]